MKRRSVIVDSGYAQRHRQSLAAANDVCVVSDAQAIFFRRRHQPRRPPATAMRPGRPAPTIGPGTGVGPTGVVMINAPTSPCGGPGLPENANTSVILKGSVAVTPVKVLVSVRTKSLKTSWPAND